MAPLALSLREDVPEASSGGVRHPRVVFDGDVLTRTHFGGAVRALLGLVGHLTRQGRPPGLLAVRPLRCPDSQSVKGLKLLDLEDCAGVDVFVRPDYSDVRVQASCTVTVVHDLIDELYPGMIDPTCSVDTPPGFKREGLLRSDHVIAVSDTTRDEVLRQFALPDKKVSVIRHGLEACFVDPPPPTFDRTASIERWGLAAPYVLHVGGRHGYKNFQHLLRGFATSLASREHLIVNVGSEVAFRPLEWELISSLGLQGRVRLLGYATDDELVALYRRAACVVLPSLCEGFGLSLLEALAVGVPVAASDIAVFRELGGEFPVMFDPGSPEQIGSAIDHVVNRADPARMSLGMEHAAQFTWQRAGDAFEALCARLVRNGVHL